ncbi:acetyltransferase (GNAT) family protein [Roseimicrobium gellanilyticum]|uniref:Acetyltransferase (GNAT) family protein n=1 Tax=Roseimicrobium gellanilyticum TaxID=748857 RepID=A0A366HNZ4_9BACT|nr:GNAT family N-acetyltransferase [Roseimicrobium gellanilyticum]RBP44506.1 acetyltransferase (GNAT) family protein [Roseimicrobium gellanilyticum]
MPPSPSPWHITPAANDDAPECEPIREWLRQHNWSANAEFMRKWTSPEHESKPLVLITKSSHGEVIGGLLAHTQFSWLRISIMAVHPNFRGIGIGAGLLADAESMAIGRGCLHAHVDTMSYQAPEFYLKHGYRLAGEFPNWDSHGHAKMHFLKSISPASLSPS